MNADRRADRRKPEIQQPVRCATCGRGLGHDKEDEPRGDAGKPICGACNRARNFDVLFGDGESR
jgi:hypothetical protein